ncbi:serine hydrolase [Streptomyces sp. ACA25]|uniref:serine hydrolase domain-containing protein n=1 Tax=Streptomyces sp. ACA25 TaxID=3022596 RepID=UPI0023071939|nr:serine hydrolase domain-containing protein [Streptomyces sp. ACA25]MDB1086221.1 serine hydrolase [Streptomyces sp. ACA25]
MSERPPPLELLPATRRALHRSLAVAQARGRAPSVVAAVVRDGGPVWCEARGTVDGEVPGADTQYRVGSITKTFVAVLVLRLCEEGLLAPGDRLEKHLPVPQGGGATVAQLLAHSAGLAAEARGPWWERTPGELRPELADLFEEGAQKHPAGRRHHYSNPGYALLGALVEKLRGGEPWFGVLRREVLEPLGMTRTTLLPQAPHATGWAVHPYADVLQPEPAVDTGRMAPAGQLWSTAGDLCRFAAFLTVGDERVLGARSLAAMRTPAVAPEVTDWESAYGLGMQVTRRGGRTLSGHSGSMPGFVAGLWTSPAEGVAGVAMANATSGLAAASLAAELVGLVADHEPAVPPAWAPMPDADPELVALAGPWYWGTLPHALRVRAGRELELGPLTGGGRSSGFDPEPDGTWTGREGYFAGETLRVVRRDDGTVSHLDLCTFVFTREPYDPAAPVPGGTDPGGWR